MIFNVILTLRVKLGNWLGLSPPRGSDHSWEDGPRARAP